MTRSRPASPAPGADAPRFETRLARLREIVEELEGGDLPLERAIERYEEGVTVLKHCAETLSKARARVEELSKEAEDALDLGAETGGGRAAEPADDED